MLEDRAHTGKIVLDLAGRPDSGWLLTMFNALRTEQLIAGIGAVGRAAAAASGPPDEYARGQLLSAYSVSRLLAAEVSAEAELLAWLRGELLDALGRQCRRRRRIEAAPDAVAIGGVLVDLLAEFRQSGEDPELRTRIHAILREMAERELLGAGRAARRARSDDRPRSTRPRRPRRWRRCAASTRRAPAPRSSA